MYLFNYRSVFRVSSSPRVAPSPTLSSSSSSSTPSTPHHQPPSLARIPSSPPVAWGVPSPSPASITQKPALSRTHESNADAKSRADTQAKAHAHAQNDADAQSRANEARAALATTPRGYNLPGNAGSVQLTTMNSAKPGSLEVPPPQKLPHIESPNLAKLPELPDLESTSFSKIPLPSTDTSESNFSSVSYQLIYYHYYYNYCKVYLM